MLTKVLTWFMRVCSLDTSPIKLPVPTQNSKTQPWIFIMPTIKVTVDETPFSCLYRLFTYPEKEVLPSPQIFLKYDSSKNYRYAHFFNC